VAAACAFRARMVELAQSEHENPSALRSQRQRPSCDDSLASGSIAQKPVCRQVSAGGFFIAEGILAMASNTNTDVDKLITFGQMALEQGWYDQAREHFEQALALDASNQEAMKGLVRVNERLSRREAAAVEPIHGEPVEPPSSVVRKRKRPWWFWALVVVLGLFGCSIVTCLGILVFVPSPKATPTPTPLQAIPKRTEPYPTATAKPYPTATAEASMGDFVIYKDIKTTIIEYEFTDSYLTSYGTEKPAEGAKFLWLHVKSENVGEVAHDLPGPWDFDLLYKDTEIGYRYLGGYRGYPQQYTEYQQERVYPGIAREGWILYEIPIGADPVEILVRFTTDREYHMWRLEAK
jgi:hypothetical protein